MALIRLEPIAMAHAPAVQALAADPRIADTSNVPHPYPDEGATTWIKYTTALREMGKEVNFAIIDTSISTLVGVCGVLNIGGQPTSGELGYWVGVPYWGRGYASAAASQLVRVVFEEWGVIRLYSSCLVRNPASFRVLEKAGFRHVGFGTHPHSKWGPHDRFAMFELTVDEWRAKSRIANRESQML